MRWLVVSALLVSSTASARTLTLEDALATAAVSNLGVVEAGLTREQARVAVSQTRASFDPTLSASFGADAANNQSFIAGLPASTEAWGADGDLSIGAATPWGGAWSVSTGLDRDVTSTLSAFTGSDDPVEQRNWSTSVTASLSQDLLAFLRTSDASIEVRKARERLDVAELSLLSATDAALLQTAEAWWTWWSAEARVDVALGTLEKNIALHERTKAQKEVGTVAQLEVDRVHAERLASERDVLLAQAEARAAADSLLVVLGLPPGEDLTLDGTERAIDAPDFGADPLALALDGNVELALARTNVDTAHATLDDARGASLPTLTGTVSGGLSPLQTDLGDAYSALTTDEKNPYGAVGVELSVPLGGRAARAGRDTAALEIQLQKARLASAEREVRADVRAAIDAVETAEQGLALAEARERVAAATEEAEADRVAVGTTRLDQLLDARASHQTAQSEVVSARVQRARAELQLIQLQGRLVGEVLDVD